jgi:hypothetical protein
VNELVQYFKEAQSQLPSDELIESIRHAHQSEHSGSPQPDTQRATSGHKQASEGSSKFVRPSGHLGSPGLQAAQSRSLAYPLEQLMNFVQSQGVVIVPVSLHGAVVVVNEVYICGMQ